MITGNRAADGGLTAVTYLTRLWYHVVRLAQRSILALVVGVGTPSVVMAGGDAYLLGVFPHLPARELEAGFSPIAAALGKALGHDVQFRSTSTFEKFLERIDEQIYDFAFMQPFDYVYAADKYGYIPLATRDEMLAAIFVVNSDSSLRSLQDLKGGKLALPPETAAVTLLAKQALQAAGVDVAQLTLSYHRSHTSCMQQVIIKEADACATAAPALRHFEKEINKELRVIGESTTIPHSLFAVHPRVPAEVRQRALEAILSWATTDEGRKLLEQGNLKPFRAVTDKEYDVVRRLGEH